MKILYDYQMFSRQKYGGITKYFCELMKHFPGEHEFRLATLFSDNNYLQENYPFFKKRKVPLSGRAFKGKKFIKDQVDFLNRYYSLRAVASGNYDLLHPTFYDSYFFKGLKKPYIITVHDLIEFKFRDTLYQDDAVRLQMKKVIEKADRLIAISNNTKKDIIETFRIQPGKIDVIYHGYNQPAPADSNNPFGRYILFVGLRDKYKNFRIFVRSIGPLLNREKDLKLVCVGKPFTTEEMAILRELEIMQQAVAINVNEKGLNQLYAHARVFVYPSLYEGFGMPILEAFANNCPVCLSDASSFPEVAGQAGVYFDPCSEGAILAAINSVMYDNDFRQQMVLAGRTRLADFSWEKTAQETIASYQKTV